jgi:hypothetical protein
MPDKSLGPPDRSGRWSPLRALLIGGLVGAILGVFWGWIDYGALEIGYLYNHVIGGAVLLGAVCCLVALLRNWRMRNPM